MASNFVADAAQAVLHAQAQEASDAALHARAANAREIFLTIYRHATYGVEPGPITSARGGEAVAIALDAHAAEAMRLQLEKDCAIVCRYCRRTTDLGAAVLSHGGRGKGSGSLLWRHPVAHARTGKPGYILCLANALRHAWHAEHGIKESNDGAQE